MISPYLVKQASPPPFTTTSIPPYNLKPSPPPIIVDRSTDMSASPELTLVPVTLALPPISTAAHKSPMPRKAEVEDEAGEECRTPTSEESRLRSIPQSCPPAPRKLRPTVRCKRRLSEMDFLIVGASEIEQLFRNLPAPRHFKRAKVSLS